MPTYKLVRFYQNHDNKVLSTGHTLAEVEKHCKDPETSSRTAKSPEAQRRTKLKGPWFDGYTKE